MEENEIKEILEEIENEDIEVFERDFLTRDTYFCLRDKDEDEFMIIVKKI